MKTKLLLPTFLLFVANLLNAQQYVQYFDGADTIFSSDEWQSSLKINIDDDSTNIWQVGVPQKTIFNSAATQPNALLTDTINPYPINNSSSFQFTIVPWEPWGILAIQWKQKLDMDAGSDGGIIEFSVDAGTTWENAYFSPFVYNFYGYQDENFVELPNGDIAFSGTDSTWRDIWLCYEMSWLDWNDSIMVRFTFVSDSLNNNREGWMIDNMLVHRTIVHTINEVDSEKYFNIYPNPADEIIHIETRKTQDFHIIEQMVLVNSLGQIVDEWKYIPIKFFINTKKYTNGMYYLKIKTNVKSETIPIIINHN